MVPREWLTCEEVVRRKGGRGRWSDDELSFLADRFRVSQEVILRRLLLVGLATEAFYRAKREEFEKQYRELREARRAGFAPPHRVAISSAGELFVRLVLNSYHQEKITASDVADFLDVRLKHLPRIECEVMGLPAGIARAL